MFALPLQVIDNFLLNYNVGQAILLLFILSILGALPLKSGKVISLNAILFGFIFLVTPGSLEPVHFKFLGVALLVVGAVLFSSTR
ncbi:MAG: hypothetical protein ABEJ06_04050 [Haloarculaceae archaeon]